MKKIICIFLAVLNIGGCQKHPQAVTFYNVVEAPKKTYTLSKYLPTRIAPYYEKTCDICVEIAPLMSVIGGVYAASKMLLKKTDKAEKKYSKAVEEKKAGTEEQPKGIRLI